MNTKTRIIVGALLLSLGASLAWGWSLRRQLARAEAEEQLLEGALRLEQLHAEVREMGEWTPPPSPPPPRH